jgi:hypothetical protein
MLSQMQTSKFFKVFLRYYCHGVTVGRAISVQVVVYLQTKSFALFPPVRLDKIVRRNLLKRFYIFLNRIPYSNLSTTPLMG